MVAPKPSRQRQQNRPPFQPPVLRVAQVVDDEKKRKTSSSMADRTSIPAAVVTVSDSCSLGEREDRSGPAVAQFLEKLHFSVTVREVVPDDSIKIQNLL